MSVDNDGHPTSSRVSLETVNPGAKLAHMSDRTASGFVNAQGFSYHPERNFDSDNIVRLTWKRACALRDKKARMISKV